LIFFRRFSPAVVISACLASLLASFRTRSALQIEILALRHQLGVLSALGEAAEIDRRGSTLVRGPFGRVGGLALALFIVKPETVIGWHRKAFRRFWTWKVRHGRPAGRASRARLEN
jgi:putative transposase